MSSYKIKASYCEILGPRYDLYYKEKVLWIFYETEHIGTFKSRDDALRFSHEHMICLGVSDEQDRA